MDALIGQKELTEFLDKLFGNEKICKIGFRFSEDLTQLRGCAAHCLSLYEPKNLICVQNLFFDVSFNFNILFWHIFKPFQLVKLCHKDFGNELDGLLVASDEKFIENPEIAAIEAGKSLICCFDLHYLFILRTR